jgi:type VI secretion system secreted protein VgrG
MLALVMGLVMLLHAQCVNPLGTIETCSTPTPTETPVPIQPEPTETPTLEPTPEATETPTVAPTATLEPTQTPIPRPPVVVVVTETPTPRETRTPIPTPEVPTPQTRFRPTLPPGPERARSPTCLAAPPPVPDLPGVRDVSWTNEQRCGGTPEALASTTQTQPVVDRPSAPTPDRPAPLVVVVILPAREQPTETPTPERMLISPPAESDEELPERREVPVQLPDDQ